MTVRFRRESPALHQPGGVTGIQLPPDHLFVCACACVCVEKERGWGVQGAAQEWFAQQIACQCPIWEKFPRNCSHVTSSELRHVSRSLGRLKLQFFFAEETIIGVENGKFTVHQMREDW